MEIIQFKNSTPKVLDIENIAIERSQDEIANLLVSAYRAKFIPATFHRNAKITRRNALRVFFFFFFFFPSSLLLSSLFFCYSLPLVREPRVRSSDRNARSERSDLAGIRQQRLAVSNFASADLRHVAGVNFEPPYRDPVISR